VGQLKGAECQYDLAYTEAATKVYAMDDLTHQLTGIRLQARHERYTDQPLGEIVISAVDSLEARRQIWDQVSQSMDTLFYLDGRMAITSMDLYAIDMLKEEAMAKYEPSLGGKAEGLPCTARATMFNAFIIAGYIVVHGLYTTICSLWKERPETSNQ
jgi:hypothetical protein